MKVEVLMRGNTWFTMAGGLALALLLAVGPAASAGERCDAKPIGDIPPEAAALVQWVEQADLEGDFRVRWPERPAEVPTGTTRTLVAKRDDGHQAALDVTVSPASGSAEARLNERKRALLSEGTLIAERRVAVGEHCGVELVYERRVAGIPQYNVALLVETPDASYAVAARSSDPAVTAWAPIWLGSFRVGAQRS